LKSTESVRRWRRLHPRKAKAAQRRAQAVQKLHPERGRMRTQRWRKANPEKSRASTRKSHAAWVKRNPEKDLDARLRAIYGITLVEREAMRKAQDGKCAICHRPSDTLEIDHNHKTERVRGLLCRSCNFAIGLLQDSPEVIETALNYVRIKGV